MNQVLDVLYASWRDTYFDDDKKMYIQEFLTCYHSLNEKDLDPVFKCIEAETNVSFQVGFKTAVQLLLESKL